VPLKQVQADIWFGSFNFLDDGLKKTKRILIGYASGDHHVGKLNHTVTRATETAIDALDQ